MYGRDRLVEQAASLLHRGGEAGAGLLVVSGEAGIGKSTFVEHLTAAEREGGALVTWSSWPGMSGPPLWAWIDVLREFDADRAARVSDTTTELFERFQIVIDGLRDVALSVPVVVVLDDAELLDDAALALAKSIPRVLRSLDVRVILIWRTDAGAVPPTELTSSGGWVEVGPLGDDAARAMVAALGGPGEVDAAMTDDIVAISAGNPLLIGHAVAAAVAASPGEPFTGVGILRSRIEALAPSIREVLATAAVIEAPQAGSATIGHVAQCARRERSEVDVAAAVGRARGFLRPVDPNEPERIEFTHASVAAAFASMFDADRSRAIHRDRFVALAANEQSSLDTLISCARHALDGWPLVDIADLITVTRRAAHGLVGQSDHGAAIRLLQRAVAIEEACDTVVASSELRVELAEAILSSGRLGDARVAFWRAIDVARRAASSTSISRSALGLGGLWVHEHRSPAALHEFLALVERALADEQDPAIADLLRARWYAERTYLGDTHRTELADVVESVRERGSERDLAKVLSLLHHTQLGPGLAHERISIAHEVLINGSRSGDSMLALMGSMWLAVDNYLVGDPSATRWHEELRARSSGLDIPALGFIAEAMDVMLMIRAGRFDEAEELAGKCATTGVAAGDLDATGYYSGHLLCSRWLQGSGEHLIPALEHMAKDAGQVTQSLLFSAVHAALAADAGRLDESRLVLDTIARTTDAVAFDVLRKSSMGLAASYCLVAAAAVVGDTELASREARYLAQFAGLPVMISLAVACFGSTEFPLGLAARTCGQLDVAGLHLSRAAEANRRLGHRPAEAMALAELAQTCVIAEDLPRARALWSEAIDLGTSLGMDARVDHWATRHESVKASSVSPIARLSRANGFWTFAVGGATVVTPESVGLKYLATMISNAPRGVSVMELTGASVDPSEHDVLDPIALRSYRARMLELEQEMAEADAHADMERSARARLEFDTLLDTLRREIRPDGRSRQFAGQSERARSSVQKAIRRALDRINESAPELARGLHLSVSTGYECRFVPNDSLPSTWIVSFNEA